MTLRIIPRIESGGDGPILFIEGDDANFGMITCYAHLGQHSEASLDYYWDTKPDHANQCAALIAEWIGIDPSFLDYKIGKRLNMDNVRKSWCRWK